MRSLRTVSPQQFLKQLSSSLLGDGESLSPWKRLLGQKAGSQQSLIFSLEQPSNATVVNESIDFSGWARSFSSEEIFAQVYVNERAVAEIEFSEIEHESIYRFEHSVPWSEACGDGVTRAEVLLRVNHGSQELLIGPLLVVRSDSPLMRHMRPSAIPTWGETLEDICASEVSDQSSEEIASAVRKLLEIGSTDRVLEIGCGRGEVGAAVALGCDQWVGCDFSGSTLSVAIQNLKHLPNIALEQLSEPRLSEWRDAEFDKVYCTSLLMFMDEWDRFRLIEESFRVLKPGGLCYFDSLNLCGDIGWLEFAEETRRDAASRPANVMKASTPQELETYFKQAGFEKVKSYPGERMLALVAAKPRN